MEASDATADQVQREKETRARRTIDVDNLMAHLPEFRFVPV